MRRQNFLHLIEYAVTLGFFYAMRALPLDVASGISGNIARFMGVHIRRSQLALKQMRAHLPGLSENEYQNILRAMWENLGRVFAEYPHMHREIMTRRITISGSEHLPENGAPFLIISGHIGNWEVIPRALRTLNKPAHVVYRPPNNPLTHGLIDRIRSRYSLGHYGKGREGARGVMAAFQAGEPVAMLIDQKDNAGARLNFMGSPAMTMTSAAKLALKFNVPVIPCFIERTKAAHFIAHFHAAIAVPVASSTDTETRELAFMQAMNDSIGAWVIRQPSQWFWLHRRWPKEAS